MLLSPFAKLARFVALLAAGLFELAGLLADILRHSSQVFHPGQRKIFLLLFLRQLYNTGLRAVSINIVLAVILGWLIISNAHAILPDSARFSDFYAKSFVILVFREVGPLLSGIILIARSASAITFEIGHLRLHNQFEILSMNGMHATFVFLLPVFYALPLSLLAMFIFFDLVCLLSAYVFILYYHGGGLSLLNFAQSIWSQVSWLELWLSCIKAIVGGALIALVSVYFGANVKNKFTQLSRAISNATTAQLFLFLAVNVSLSLLAYT